jgi:hypothetical protein
MRVTVRFANLDVEFTDRDRAIEQVIDLGEKGTWRPIVIYGPEGCGKSALLKQATAILRDLGYKVFYLNPLGYVFDADVSFPDIKRAFLEFVREALAENALGRIAWAVFDFVNKVLSVRRGEIAVIADDVFQVIGVDKAAAYVKGLLNMVEHPQYNYENMVILVATSEGLSREEIGRHRWADIMPTWNMPRDNMHYREQQFWIDEPPPERDRELGVGRYIVWQTPLHGEAVRQALREASA